MVLKLRTPFLNSIVTDLLPLLLIVATACIYFWYLGTFAVNIPQGDDIQDVLNFVSGVVKAENWKIAVKLFFEQHNDHRTSASRLIYYAAYVAQDEINFRTLVLVANIALPLILGLLYIRLRHHKYRWLILLPVALLLFQLHNYNLVVWTTAAFAFFFAFLYGFCCIYALHSVTPSRFILAIVFAILANLTLASGQIIWLVGLGSLLQQGLIRKSISIRYAFFWVLFTVVDLSVWYWDFVPDKINIEVAKVIFPNNSIGAPILESIAHQLHFFLILLGSAASNSSAVAAVVFGAICMAVLAVVSATSYRNEDLRVEFCCWYVVLSAAAITWGRSQWLAVDYAMNPRYGFPSILMLSLTWVLVALRIRKNPLLVLIPAVLVAGIYSITSYRTYPVLYSSFINRYISDFNDDRYMSFEGNLSNSVHEAILLGVYKPPLRPLPLHKVDDQEQSSKQGY